MNDMPTPDTDDGQKSLDVVTIDPPPEDLRFQRKARPVGPDEKKDRYHLPRRLQSDSPVGYRERVGFSRQEAEQLVGLLSLDRPTEFVDGAEAPTEGELFEEASLGVVTSRQSTNYRGHRETVLGPEDSKRAAEVLRGIEGREAPVLDGATHTHVVFSRPYRTPFTLLLTFVGHDAFKNLLTVPMRALRKTFLHEPDIPTVEYLQHLHVGILADEMERAAVVASGGRRRAQIFMAPFAGAYGERNRQNVEELGKVAGLTDEQYRKGWRVAMVAQVGEVPDDQKVDIDEDLLRRFGANKVAFRSERILAGDNQEEKAPEEYQHDQGMDVPDALTVQSGRAAYNAFCHWTDVDRQRAKEVLLMERIDVLSEHGRERLDDVEEMLDTVTDKLIDNLPLWADLLSGFALSRNAERGRKAFALAGQRIYLGGLDRTEVRREQLDWHQAVRAAGAASARSALYAELMGVTEVPDDCDMLAGLCQMAGPVNQNDIGKAFYDQKDLLADSYPEADPTSLLVWTLKAKTVADPIGNEEQLLNDQQQGSLVDLRPGPHEIVELRDAGDTRPMRQRDGQTNSERAFGDVGNFATSPTGEEIPGNRGATWPKRWRQAPAFE